MTTLFWCVVVVAWALLLVRGRRLWRRMDFAERHRRALQDVNSQ